VGKLIKGLKITPNRFPKYLKWLKTLPCMCCGTKDDITAAHLAVSNFGRKGDDSSCVPLCGVCHSLQEYHKNKFKEFTVVSLPTLKDADFYYQLYKQRNPQ